MSPIPDQFPISVRAWPTQDDKATALASLITRINAERGNFRSVTEDTLEEEIRQIEAGRVADKGDLLIDEEEDEDEPDRLKELLIAREEILSQLEQAHNASMVALDFVSLLLSKDTPVQASLSISPALRDAVPLGTIGSDKLSESRTSPAQLDENERVGKGWKLQCLNDSMNSLLDSATRLAKEIETETKYWEEILIVSDKGWAICRMPNEKHTLGVRFGFAESAPEFRNRSLTPLIRNVDGTISLSHGFESKRLRVRIQTSGIITGELHLGAVPDPASVESLILNARNTIFAEELWQELNREARILANHGARLTGEEISCPITATKRIILDLVTTEDEEPFPREPQEDNKIAEMILLSLHLLLSYAHRQNLRRRSQSPPLISQRPPPNPPYYILRAIIVFLNHQNVLATLRGLLSPLSTALLSTGLVSEKSTVNSPSLTILDSNGKSVQEQVIENLVFDLTAELILPITSTDPSQVLNVNLRTVTDPRSALEAYFFITATGPLARSCRPPPNSTSVDEVRSYILWAVACALAESFSHNDFDDYHASYSVGENSNKNWSKTHDPTVLRKTINDERDQLEIAFRAVMTEYGDAEIRVLWRHIALDRPGQGTVRRFIWNSKGTGENGTLTDVIDSLVKETENLPVRDSPSTPLRVR